MVGGNPGPPQMTGYRPTQQIAFELMGMQQVAVSQSAAQKTKNLRRILGSRRDLVHKTTEGTRLSGQRMGFGVQPPTA
jgi:hypothetical protein